jgi:ATP-dependent DNA ligase
VDTRGTYRADGRATSWLKIKNREYTRIQDRHELFAARDRTGSRGRAPGRSDLVFQ